MNTQDASLAGSTMPLPVRASAAWLGRVSSGVIIMLMLLDGATRLVPWPMVAETMDRMGYGSSENLARFLGAISLMGMALNAFPPTSFVGAILTTCYLGSLLASHVKIESPLLTGILFGAYFGVMLWGALWLRRRRYLLPFAV